MQTKFLQQMRKDGCLQSTAVLLNTMGVTFSRYGCDMSEIAGHRLQETSETSQYHVELSFYENISRGCQW
jgi:hypothetical protein